MDKVSIILPCYNIAPYIKKCINSILNQSYKHLEIIIVNDGSTDQTLELAEELAKNDNRIKIIDSTNQGVSIARNKGIDLSTGEYIIFIDPDDYIHKDFVKSLYDRLIDTEADLTIAGHTKIFDDGTEIKSKTSCSIFKEEDIFKEYFTGQSTLTKLMCDKIFKSNIIKKNRIYCPYEVTSGQDQVFILEYLIFCDVVSTVSNNYYYYYQRNGSKSKRYEYFIFERTLVKLDYLKLILNKKGIFNKYHNYYKIRLYMNLFSQGLLLYKYQEENFAATFNILKKNSLTYIKKNKFTIFWDIILFSKMNLKEKIACLIIYFSPVFFIKKLFVKYIGMEEGLKSNNG